MDMAKVAKVLGMRFQNRWVSLAVSFGLTAAMLRWLDVGLVGYGFLAMFVLWMLFATLMAMRDRHVLGKLPKWAVWVGMYVVLPVGAVVDVVFNWTVGVYMFLDPARELMLTSRLKRYLHEGRYRGTWRYKEALFICKYMVEPHDVGHCGLGKLK